MSPTVFDMIIDGKYCRDINKKIPQSGLFRHSRSRVSRRAVNNRARGAHGAQEYESSIESSSQEHQAIRIDCWNKDKRRTSTLQNAEAQSKYRKHNPEYRKKNIDSSKLKSIEALEYKYLDHLSELQLGIPWKTQPTIRFAVLAPLNARKLQNSKN